MTARQSELKKSSIFFGGVSMAVAVAGMVALRVSPQDESLGMLGVLLGAGTFIGPLPLLYGLYKASGTPVRIAKELVSKNRCSMREFWNRSNREAVKDALSGFTTAVAAAGVFAFHPNLSAFFGSAMPTTSMFGLLCAAGVYCGGRVIGTAVSAKAVVDAHTDKLPESPDSLDS